MINQSTMSITAEEALSRAKAIAARLSGTTDASAAGDSPEPPSSVTTTKRKRWGVAPAIVTAAAAQEVLPGLADAAKKAKMESPSSSSCKKIWVRTTRERGAAHFKAYFATRLTDLEAEINNGKSNDGNEKVKLELKGRGASGKPALPGIPGESILLIGSNDASIWFPQGTNISSHNFCFYYNH